MGATKKVLWAFVLLTTVDLIAGKHLGMGMPLSQSWVRGESAVHAQADAAAQRPDRTLARAERDATAYTPRR